MTATEKKAKPIVSKKWLYGSLVALALIWGIYTNTEAANSSEAPYSLEHVQIDNDDIDMVTDNTEDDYPSDDNSDDESDDDTDQEWGYDSLDDEE